MAKNWVTNESDHIVIGWRAIATLMGVAAPTVRRWENYHGFPIARLPDGRVCTSRPLVDQWLLARQRLHREKTRPDTGSQPDPVNDPQSVDN